MCCNRGDLPPVAVPVPQSRVRALTEMQAPLGELRELLEEAEGLPVAMPEVQQIQVGGGRVSGAGKAGASRDTGAHRRRPAGRSGMAVGCGTACLCHQAAHAGFAECCGFLLPVSLRVPNPGSRPPFQALIEGAEAWQRQLEGLMRGRAAVKRVCVDAAAGSPGCVRTLLPSPSTQSL